MKGNRQRAFMYHISSWFILYWLVGTNLIISGGNSCEIYLVEASKYENAG
jgi:hypothetical protein